MGVAQGSVGVVRDAFGLPEVSQRQTLFDSKHLFDALPLIYDDQEVSGSGTGSTWTQPYVDMTVSANTAGRRVRQTFDRYNYQPGKGLFIELTGVLGEPQAGVIRRAGYYDDDNGIFLESNGVLGDMFFVIRNKGANQRVSRTGLNGYEKWNSVGLARHADYDKQQIIFFELEWLGVGDVGVGLGQNRTKDYFHVYDHYNALTVPYMALPNLPVRYEIIADGTNPEAATLRHTCSTVMSQGGNNDIGFIHTASRDTSAFTMASNTSWQPLLSVRLNAARLAATVEILNAKVPIPTSASDALLEVGIFINPTIGGTDAASWVQITNSSIEVDVSRDNTNTLTGGTRISGDYVTKSRNEAAEVNLSVPNVRKLGANIAGDADEFVLAARFLDGTAPTVYALMNLRELA